MFIKLTETESKDEMNEFVKKFMLFKGKPIWQEASEYIENSKNELSVFHDFLAEYNWKNFRSIFKKIHKEGWKIPYFLGKFFLEIQFTAQTMLFELEILNIF